MKSIKTLFTKIRKSTDPRALKNIIAITAIFVVVITAGGIWLKYMPVFEMKEQSTAYDEIAQNLSNGNGFVWNNGSSANETPGYPYSLAVIYSVAGNNYNAIKVIQLLFLGLIGVFVYLICKRLSIKYSLALAAGLVTATWPYFLLYSNLILPEIALALFLIISMYLLLLFQKTPTYLKSVGLGVVLGLYALTRPMIMLLPFWLAICILIFIPQFRKSKNFLKLLLFIVAFIVALAPWTIRNYKEFNELSPVKSEISNMQDIERDSIIPQEQILQESKTSYLKNIYLFWNPGATGKRAEAITDKFPNAKQLILIYRIVFFLILALAIFSWKFLKQKKILLLWLCVAYFWAGYAIGSPLPRLALPVIPIIIVLCFFTINYLSPLLFKKSKKSKQN